MTTKILAKIRDLMRVVGYKNTPIQALIVTNHDAHSSEYLADCDSRLRYVSGFNGSFGTAIITEHDALMWTDGRYFIQAENEMDSNWTLMKVGVHGTLTEPMWLCNKLPEGSLVGTDPRLIPYSVWVTLEKELSINGISLVPLATNFVDTIWTDRPSLVATPIVPLDIKFTGETSASKIVKIKGVMKEKGVDLLILSALDDIAWVLNLRGGDISFNPLFFCFLTIRLEDQIEVFIDEERITDTIRNHFIKDNVNINFRPYDSIYSSLAEMVDSTKKVWICRSANYQIYDTFPESKRVCECSPAATMKAVKNESEIQGMINAHVKDGVALCRYFSWLEKVVANEGSMTELAAARVLDSYRMEEEHCVGPSFPTISSSGPNAAIIHYFPSEGSNRILSIDEIYLCDSGGQYLEGTTDVTRTVHFGTPTEFQKECFTRVFKGLVALVTAKFPYGIKGNCLDTLARKALWDVGLDYKHGTGHGIGSYLCVHEGPMGISWRSYPDDPGLQPNMFVSDEPGYYHAGEFGIRLENIVQIVPSDTVYHMPMEKGFLTFETVTLCPIQIKMLNISLLSAEEIRFLNSYHRKVREILGPLLENRGFTEAYQWLLRETEPVEEGSA